MQIRKNKAGTTIKLTRAEVRQVEAAQEIIDTVRLLGGSLDDIEEGLQADGVISIGPKRLPESSAEMLEPEGDLEAVEAPVETPKQRSKRKE